MKLVTLLPSATEIVARLGLEKNLVGVSHECDFPETVASLPKLTSSRINTNLSSGNIHQSVMDVMKSAVSVYDLDIELLKSLQPDFIITQDLCDVCAVSFDQVEKACQEVLDKNTRIISLKPKMLGDIWDDIQNVADQLSVSEKGREFKTEVDARINAVKTRRDNGTAPKVLTIEWLDPIYIGGMWLPEMIDIVGGEVCFAKSGQLAPVVKKGDLAKIEPDVVLVKPCGYKLDQTLKELELLREQLPDWKNPPRIYLVDGNSYFNRPGPRILDSLEILAYCTHPELFADFGEHYKAGIIELGSELPSS
ncbi:MAG: iron complex transport system substrate-binding protein [Nitrospinales bacterium]|jgi:iron complex transport system substrate-binding protein